KGEAEADIAAFKQATDAIKIEIETKIQKHVLKLIPAQSADDAVSVVSYVSVDVDIPQLELPLTESLGEFLSQWGSTMGLGLFAIWALWMLNKSMPQIEEVDTAAHVLPTQQAAASASESEEGASNAPKELTQRDEIQLQVRDNPEVTALVLSKWIHSSS
ncbi:MAG: hypothetical protein QM501_12220, partial [Gimesia sp.]